MMRVLLVENEQTRVDWFAETYPLVAFFLAQTPSGAIAMLGDREYDELWLDHDLGCEPEAGRDVALWLIAHPENNRSMFVRIHSLNVVSGPKIWRELRAAGRSAEWIPFGTRRDGDVVRYDTPICDVQATNPAAD